MATIVPSEVHDLLCRWEAAPVFPTTLDSPAPADVVPFDDCASDDCYGGCGFDDADSDEPLRYTLTPLGEDATGGPLAPCRSDLAPCRSDLARCCPECGGPLITDSLYCGGRGYKTYHVCNSGECSFMRRID